jgi:hypothetical protein
MCGKKTTAALLPRVNDDKAANINDFLNYPISLFYGIVG